MSPAEKMASSRKPSTCGRKKRTYGRWTCLLAEKRRKLGLTLREVAAAVDMSVAGLHACEAGQDVCLSRAKKLAEFFGADVWELWPTQIGGVDE